MASTLCITVLASGCSPGVHSRHRRDSLAITMIEEKNRDLFFMLGVAVARFAGLEFIMESTIDALGRETPGVEADRDRVCNMHFSGKRGLLSRLCQESPHASVLERGKSLCEQLDDCNKERNALVHGVWASTPNEATPTLVRPPYGSRRQTELEDVSVERVRALADSAKRLTVDVSELAFAGKWPA